ncbi:MAG TPA: ABC transporter ATP-binding protein [Rhodopila sp.]
MSFPDEQPTAPFASAAVGMPAVGGPILSADAKAGAAVGSAPGWMRKFTGRSGSPASEDNGIEVRNVQVRHGRHVALEGVNGRFATGSLTAVVGPNGAGKSTLLNVISGLTRPNRGEVVCAARGRKRMAYLQQQTELDRDFPVTVAELVGLGLWRNFGAFRAPRRVVTDRVVEAVGAVGLLDSIDRRIGELSVGQLRRAFFARLLLLDAEVMLLDEPFAAVDTRTVESLLTLMGRWHQEGRTIVAVMHEMDQVRAYFPSTLLLARSPVAWGETGAVLTGGNLAKALSVA